MTNQTPARRTRKPNGWGRFQGQEREALRQAVEVAIGSPGYLDDFERRTIATAREQSRQTHRAEYSQAIG